MIMHYRTLIIRTRYYVLAYLRNLYTLWIVYLRGAYKNLEGFRSMYVPQRFNHWSNVQELSNTYCYNILIMVETTGGSENDSIYKNRNISTLCTYYTYQHKYCLHSRLSTQVP